MKPIKIFDLKFSKKDINFFINNSKNIFKEGFFSNHTYVKKLKIILRGPISLNLH